MSDAPLRSRSFVAAVVGCAVLGAGAIGGTFLMQGAVQARPMLASEDYGRRLLSDTAALMGPDHADPAMRYSGSRLACSSCHLDAGTQLGALSLMQAAGKYPRFSGRDGGIGDLEARINGCMTRSMNGRALPEGSVEMASMVAYISSLGQRFEAMGMSTRAFVEPKAFKTPDRAADLDAGQRVFGARCAVCHGPDGQGLPAAGGRANGYVFPPLWGPDSFNDGAGMHRVLTAARFIKAKMPLGKPVLSDDEAFDVAAYINAQPRPEMAGLERDYPDRATKPVDNAYGPFADPFPLEQHRFGPFAPIEEYYKAHPPAKR